MVSATALAIVLSTEPTSAPLRTARLIASNPWSEDANSAVATLALVEPVCSRCEWAFVIAAGGHGPALQTIGKTVAPHITQSGDASPRENPRNWRASTIQNAAAEPARIPRPGGAPAARQADDEITVALTPLAALFLTVAEVGVVVVVRLLVAGQGRLALRRPR
jgi:hypothetical protein